MIKYITFTILSLFITCYSYSQEGGISSENELNKCHYIGVFSGQTLIFKNKKASGETGPAIIPTVGIDYAYFFNEKMAIGTKIDFELSSYIVKTGDEELIKRENAVLPAIVFIYEAKSGITFYAGPGYEIERNASFWAFKIGTELGKTFEKGWGAYFSLCTDIKKVNTSLDIGLTVSKKFKRK